MKPRSLDELRRIAASMREPDPLPPFREDSEDRAPATPGVLAPPSAKRGE